ncbi:MAG: hypothetical protein KatS3mg082_2370 [Nitrospiraceae bacterium]|nr:MAG: hypothetical protein KatS3mg082_2370 [Nitrospiraceae bacterium]
MPRRSRSNAKPSSRSARRAEPVTFPIPPGIKRRFQMRLLKWYKQHGRDLPWRKTSDPYKILVSEVMLQQTQVDRVRPPSIMSSCSAIPH